MKDHRVAIIIADIGSSDPTWMALEDTELAFIWNSDMHRVMDSHEITIQDAIRRGKK